MNNNNRGNNNNGNNRRRGRGNNNNRQGGGGGQQTNRIDSRARGNAPQMLEKFRKLAHDAHLNGDRVQSEYYLQFADHYFRVIADTRVRQEEQRARRDENWREGDAPRDDSDGGDDFSVESDFPAFDQAPPAYASRREREERAEAQNRAESQERPERPERQSRPERQERPERQPRRDERPDREAAQTEPQQNESGEEAEVRAANPYEPPENPFVRPNRNSRGLRPRRDDRQLREERGETVDAGEAPGLDPSLLPPSIARDEEVPAEVAEAKPRRRARRKPTDEGDAEALATVG